MLRRGRTRTGIDLGTSSVKLVRGEGSGRLERVTHVGIADLPPGETMDPAAGAELLREVLGRLHLRPSQLGRVSVAIGGDQLSLREATVPALAEAELRRALPFEARKHLLLEGLPDPCLDAQVLESTSIEGDSNRQMRVLFAAGAGPRRARLLETLGRVGFEPEVIDLEPLSLLNALYGEKREDPETWGAQAILDLGASQARLHVGHPRAGVLTRAVGGRLPAVGNDPEPYLRPLLRNIEETLTYYRGHHRRSADRLHLTGGGGVRPEIAERLGRGLPLPTAVFDVLERAPQAVGRAEAASQGTRLTVAYGLARWWDADV